MKLTPAHICYALIIVAIAACHPSPARRQAEALRAGISVDSTALGMTIEPELGKQRIRLTLENWSDDWMLLNLRLGLGPKDSTSTLWAEVTNIETGRVAGGSCLQKSLPARPARYLELPPSSRFSFVLLLSCYEFPSRGRVRVVVHFREPEQQPPRTDNPVAVWFKGESTSNAIELAVGPLDGQAR